MVGKSLLIACLLMFLTAGANAQNEYVGAAKCKMCHNKTATGAQYKVWAASKHASAMDALEGEDADNPKCLKCHSTYYGDDEDLMASIKPSEGVSCESCHGAGSGYKSNTVMKDKDKSIAKGLVIPTEKVCKKCHNDESPHFKGFNFDEYFKKIAHPIPADD